MTIIRRFGYMPPHDVLTEIEGVDIIDQEPPNVSVGSSTGCVLLCGEFAAGPFDTPTVCEGSGTLQDTFGAFALSLVNPFAWDGTKYTNPYSNGNAYAWLAKKRYRKLVLCRVDNTLAEGVALKLTDTGLTAATGTITLATGANLISGETVTVSDGNPDHTPVRFEFRTSGAATAGNVLVTYEADDTATEVAALLRTAINAATGLDVTAAVPVGAVLTLTNDFAGAHGNVAITDTVAHVSFVAAGMSGGVGERWLTTDVRLPAGTRVYDASSVQREYATAQPITIAAGTDLLTAGFTVFDPTDLDKIYETRTVSDVPVYSTKGVAENAVADVDTVNAIDLFRAGFGTGSAHPTMAWAASTGALDGSAANAAALVALTSSQYDTRYQNALDACMPGAENVDDVEIVACARTSTAIRAAIKAHVPAAASVGSGRFGLLRPPIGTLPAAVNSNADPGVGANRSDYVAYCYPHKLQRLDELAELDPDAAFSIPDILVGADSDMAVLLSYLPPEENPGQTTGEYFPGGLLQHISSLEPGLTGAGKTVFTTDHYIAFKEWGVAALQRNVKAGEWVFQSGVTTIDPTIYPGLATIKRRRFASYVQDSLAGIATKFNKKLRTSIRADALHGEQVDFLERLASPEQPESQRIAAYSTDSKRRNTKALQGTGVHIIEIKVQMLDDFGKIVLATQIGETVTVEASDAI